MDKLVDTSFEVNIDFKTNVVVVDSENQSRSFKSASSETAGPSESIADHTGESGAVAVEPEAAVTVPAGEASDASTSSRSTSAAVSPLASVSVSSVEPVAERSLTIAEGVQNRRTDQRKR